MKERKKSGFHLKEMHKFQAGSDYYGLVVEETLFFKMNRATWEILDAFPDMSKLAANEQGEKYREAIASLWKNGLISREPAAPEHAHPELPLNNGENGLSTLGLNLIETVNSAETMLMSTSTIHKAIDFLLKYSGSRRHLTLLFISHNVPATLDAMTEAVAYAAVKEKACDKTIRFALRTADYHLSPRCTWFLRDHGIAVEFVIKADEVESHLEALSASAQDQMEMVTLDMTGWSGKNLGTVLRKLQGVGLNHVYVDSDCAFCRGSGKTSCTGAIPGALNQMPLIYAVMTSRKIAHGCRAGVDYAAVTANGDIYACHHQQFRLGHVSQDIPDTLPIPPVMLDNHCRGCGVRYFCGSGPGISTGPPSPEYCEAKHQLIHEALASYHRLTPRQRRAVINTYHRMTSAMPFRWLAPIEREGDRISRQLKVAGSSMKPLLKEGDVVMVEPPADGSFKWGDIICYGKPATCHRVIWKSHQNGQDYVFEKGDNRINGRRIPLTRISGKVVAVRKNQRTLKLDKISWTMVNRFMALASLLVFGLGKVFSMISKKNITENKSVRQR